LGKFLKLKLIVFCGILFGFTVYGETNNFELRVSVEQNDRLLEWSVKTNGVAWLFSSFEIQTNRVDVKVVGDIYKDSVEYFLLRTNRMSIYRKWYEKDIAVPIVSDLQTHPPKVRLLVNCAGHQSRELVWLPKGSPDRHRTFSDSNEEEVFVAMVTTLLRTAAHGVPFVESKQDSSEE